MTFSLWIPHIFLKFTNWLPFFALAASKCSKFWKHKFHAGLNQSSHFKAIILNSFILKTVFCGFPSFSILKVFFPHLPLFNYKAFDFQEAFKITEDIHNLMMISKKLPNPKTMANYYQKLAMVFWKAGYYLFHAAALFKLFQLSKEMKKNLTPEELQRWARWIGYYRFNFYISSS